MELGPVFFANPWGLISLLSLPAILGIYFFRRTFRRKEISGLFLWENVTRTRSSGRRVDRPPFTWNLLLQLLIAFLLSMLIARPRFRSGHRHHVMLIDRSASMHAEQSDGRTSFERAVSKAKEKLSGLPSDARVTLLTTGYPVTRAGSDLMDPRTALERLSRMEPGYQSYDLEKAIQQAYHLGGSEAITYFYTDRPPSSYDGPLPDRFHWHAVGASLDNVAWTAARRKPGPDGPSRVFVQLKNYSKTERSVRVQFRSVGDVLLTKSITAGANDSWRATVELDLGGEELEVVLNSGGDALTMDDRVVLRRPFKKVVRAGVTGLRDSVRNLVIDGLSSVNHVRLLNGASRSRLLNNADLMLGPSGSAFLSSYDGVYLGLKDLDQETVQRHSFVRGPYFLNEQHPLLRNIVFHGLVFGGVSVEQPPEYRTSLLSAGNTPLIYTSPAGSDRQFLANFDPHYSTIKSSVAWPMLMTNLAELARERLPGPARGNFRMDEAVELSTRRGAGVQPGSEPAWTLAFPGNGRRSLEPGRDVQIRHLSGPPGRYVLRRETEDQLREWPFRVNFLYPEESNLLDLGEGNKTSTDPPARVRTRWSEARPLKLGLIVFLAVACLGSWFLADRAGGEE